MDEKLTKDQFAELPENKRYKNGTRFCGFFCYALAVINLCLIFLNFTAPGTPKAYFLVDVFIMCCLGYFIGTRKSLIAAIICLLYGSLNYLLLHSGYLFVFIGIAAVMTISKLNSSYRSYLRQLPSAPGK